MEEHQPTIVHAYPVADDGGAPPVGTPALCGEPLQPDFREELPGDQLCSVCEDLWASLLPIREAARAL